jgi:tetratricopeptide (TPR) repeat protein
MFNLFRRQDKRPPLERAVELARKGQPVEAEELLLETAREAETRHGEGTPEAASAWNDLAALLMNLHQMGRAVEAMRHACSGPMPDSGEPLKDRLTYEMNLGQILEATGDLDGAESALRKSVDGREQFYGRTHPGYAFGLEPLAELLMRRERYEDALPLLQEVMQNFWNARHPRLAGAVALRAEALKGAGDPTPPFAGLDSVPDDLAGQVVDAVIARRDDAAPAPYRAVLKDLLAFAEERFGPDSDQVLHICYVIAEHERRQGADGGDHEARVAATRRVVETQDRKGKASEALEALMGLALAQSDAGRPDDAAASYRNAVVRAERTGDAQVTSQVLRNYGLFLAEIGRKGEAEQAMRRAVTVVETRRDAAEMLGRARVALGIFLQHDGRLDEARPFLDAAVCDMDPAHPDAVCARSHRDAIVRGGSCGCGDTGEAFVAAFKQFVMDRLPEGMVKELKVEMDEKSGLSIGLEVNRELADEEAQHLNRVLSHATEEFRSRFTA